MGRIRGWKGKRREEEEGWDGMWEIEWNGKEGRIKGRGEGDGEKTEKRKVG